MFAGLSIDTVDIRYTLSGGQNVNRSKVSRELVIRNW